MTREEVLRKHGELFALRHYLNLSSDVLDTPDFYWENEELETLYNQVCVYFCINKRSRVSVPFILQWKFYDWLQLHFSGDERKNQPLCGPYRTTFTPSQRQTSRALGMVYNRAYYGWSAVWNCALHWSVYALDCEKRPIFERQVHLENAMMERCPAETRAAESVAFINE